LTTGCIYTSRPVSDCKEFEKNKETPQTKILDRDLRGSKDVLLFRYREWKIPKKRSQATYFVYIPSQGMCAKVFANSSNGKAIL
jgi:hypothetical protein